VPCNATTGNPFFAGTTAQSGIRLIEPNQMFEDRLNQVDIRFTKIVRLGRTRIQGMFDIYNIFNSNWPFTVTNTFSTQPSSLWLRPTNVLPARFFKLGMQFDF